MAQLSRREADLEIITVEDLSQAIQDRIGLVTEEAERDAEFVMDIFGFNDRIIDNVLEPEDRQLFYILEQDGRTVEGKLVGFDQYMNLVLEESEERQTFHKAGSTEPPSVQTRRLGTVILRGNNVVTISPQ